MTGFLGKREIMNAVAAALYEHWPDWDIHRNLCPSGFKRPCFLLEAPRVSRRDATCDLIEETVYLTVTCYAALDAVGHSDVDALAQLQTDVIDLFRAGFLRVADRAVKFEASEGGMDFEQSWVDLQTSYFERRGEEIALPLMREIHNKTTG